MLSKIQSLSVSYFLEIPVRDKNPDWKKVFKENKLTVNNWKTGKCNVVECTGHEDK